MEVVNDGYRLGWRWIRDNPGAFARLAAARLEVAWRGAALGWTGRGLPWGLAGERRAVDLTVPRGPGFAAWRVALLAACLAGVWFGRRERLLHLWLLFAATKVAVVVAFFGYARHGATLIPVVALLTALAAKVLGERLSPGWASDRRALRIAVVVALLGLGVEGQRYFRPPTLILDGREIGDRDPLPAEDHLDRVLELSD